jgi:hypothetical protein
MNIEKTYAKVEAFHSNKNKEEIYADVKTSKQNKTKILEKKKIYDEVKTSKQNTRLWGNCGINQLRILCQESNVLAWPPVNTSLPNTTRRKRHEKK